MAKQLSQAETLHAALLAAEGYMRCIFIAGYNRQMAVSKMLTMIDSKFTNRRGRIAAKLGVMHALFVRVGRGSTPYAEYGKLGVIAVLSILDLHRPMDRVGNPRQSALDCFWGYYYDLPEKLKEKGINYVF